MYFGLVFVPYLFAGPNVGGNKKDNVATDIEGSDTDVSLSGDSFDEASMNSFSCADESLFTEVSLAALYDLIGPEVGKDALDTKFDGTGLPPSLEHEVVIELPVGYFRIRKAFLSGKSSFWKKAILRNTLSYRK